MKYTALLSLVLLMLLFFFVKRTKTGRELVQHFYFQTFIILFLVVNLIIRLIHFKLTFWSIIAVAVLCLCLATGAPHYMQKLRKWIRK